MQERRQIILYSVPNFSCNDYGLPLSDRSRFSRFAFDHRTTSATILPPLINDCPPVIHRQRERCRDRLRPRRRKINCEHRVAPPDRPIFGRLFLSPVIDASWCNQSFFTRAIKGTEETEERLDHYRRSSWTLSRTPDHSIPCRASKKIFA